MTAAVGTGLNRFEAEYFKLLNKCCEQGLSPGRRPNVSKKNRCTNDELLRRHQGTRFFRKVA
jgi:hypothetical protein